MHEGFLCDRVFQFLSSMFISEVSMAKRFDSEQIAPLADANFAVRSQLSDCILLLTDGNVEHWLPSVDEASSDAISLASILLP